MLTAACDEVKSALVGQLTVGSHWNDSHSASRCSWQGVFNHEPRSMILTKDQQFRAVPSTHFTRGQPRRRTRGDVVDVIPSLEQNSRVARHCVDELLRVSRDD